MTNFKTEYVTMSTVNRTGTQTTLLLIDVVRGTGDSGTVSWDTQGLTDRTVTYRLRGPATAVDRVVESGRVAGYW
jgi:hypothetical protein